MATVEGTQQRLLWSPAARQIVLQAASAGYPHETCGVLVGSTRAGTRRVEHATVARNANAVRTRDRYTLDPRDLLRAENEAAARGLEVLGFWHSHPDHPAEPSATDRAHAWPGYVYVIVSVERGTPRDVRAWRLAADRFVEEPTLVEPIAAKPITDKPMPTEPTPNKPNVTREVRP